MTNLLWTMHRTSSSQTSMAGGRWMGWKHARLRTLFIAVTIAAIAATSLPGIASAQFGKNKVQYKDFDWLILPTEHFDIYYNEGQEEIGKLAALLAEAAYTQLSEDLRHELSSKIPVIIYGSHNDFTQTNVTLSHLGEGVGGFTELFKNRVVVPYNGSYSDFRHVLVHELVHVFTFDIVYGGLIESLIRRAYLFPLPLWFTEGTAEYLSSGWDTNAEMIIRDATISNAIIPLDQLYGGYVVYKEGQSVLNFIAERYGEEKVGDILRNLRVTNSMQKALKQTTGLTVRQLSENWSDWLRRKYWPLLADKEYALADARAITNHREEGSYFNIGPALSPDGDKIVLLTDRSDRANIIMISAIDGKLLGKLVEGETSDAFETMHILRIGFGWSPDGKYVAFCTKSGEFDKIHIIDVSKQKVVRSIKPGLDGVFTPSFSPDGSSIVFSGLKDGQIDLYTIDLGTEELNRLTDNEFDEANPRWTADGRKVIFASDKDSPRYVEADIDYDIYGVDTESLEVEKLAATTGVDKQPYPSPDGRRIVFVSDASGTPNLYIADLDSNHVYQFTDLLGGAFSPTWSRDGERLAYAFYNELGYDVAVVKHPDEVPAIGPKLAAVHDAEDVTAIGPQPEVLPSDLAEILEEGLDLAGDTLTVVSKEYEVKFTPDWVTGGLQYSTEFGFGGSTQIALSDIMGNHRIYLASDIFSSLEASDVYVMYNYLPRRTNYGIGAFHFKNYYFSDKTGMGEYFAEQRYFTERNYGVIGTISRPFNKFRRIDLDLTAMGIERTRYKEDVYGRLKPADTVYRTVFLPSLSIVFDTALWGPMEPISGGRSMLTIAKAFPISDNSYSFETLIGDTRHYFRLGRRSSVAFRLVGAASRAPSEGDTAQHFFLGGTYTIRGHDDFEFVGTKAVLMNLEVRYPFIDELKIAGPIPLYLGGIRGVLFFDAGGAWYDTESFQGATWNDGEYRFKDIKAGYGVGARMALSFMILRLDLGWPTDMASTGKMRVHFAIGGQF